MGALLGCVLFKTEIWICTWTGSGEMCAAGTLVTKWFWFSKKEAQVNEYTHTHRTCLTQHTLQPGKGEAKARLQDTLSWHWEPAHPSALGRWLEPWAASKKKKKIKNICWSTFLLLNHEINTHVPSSEQIRLSQNLQSPEHCPDQTGALFSAREHFLQGWALCWQHQILSWFHYLSKLTPQVTGACDKTSVNPSMASSDPYFVLSSLVEVTLPQQGQVCPLHSCV